MSSRLLNILNAFGCLALVGIITVQWLNERSLEAQITTVAVERDTARQEAETLEARRITLESDITTLKESIAAIQQAAELTSNELTAKTELVEKLQTDLDTARTQIIAWEKAVIDRDSRIVAIQSDLIKTRARLDEAIVQIKAVAKEN